MKNWFTGILRCVMPPKKKKRNAVTDGAEASDAAGPDHNDHYERAHNEAERESNKTGNSALYVTAPQSPYQRPASAQSTDTGFAESPVGIEETADHKDEALPQPSRESLTDELDDSTAGLPFDERPVRGLPTPIRNLQLSPNRNWSPFVDKKGHFRSKNQRVQHYVENKRRQLHRINQP
ncbi:hypothetical protein AAVH_13670 [Aphelenchoides avenae]|nr:hypothetical protein AAVH_35714 [Aphelenchus avenae]KAH7718900.1 hypothetical protein AAVH_13670 [Aphelenchus avenae]